MPENRQFKRKSPRLKGYDYSQDGAYFVTICTYKRQHLFGYVDKDGMMQLNDYGKIVRGCWQDLPDHYNNIELDAFVVMPNHVHAIIFILNPDTTSDVAAGLRPATTPESPSKKHGLTEFVRALKSFSARRINEKRNVAGVPVWQRSFYDHIIRDEISLNKLREYTLYNPAWWAEDKYYSEQ